MEIRELHSLPRTALAPLVAESEREGFQFLRRLVDDYDAGRVRFDGPGETLLGAYRGSELIAVGGVTVDPYSADSAVGRIRHVYVRRSERRAGVGRHLLAALEAHARGHFRALVLRTDAAAATRFYVALGYAPLPPGGTATHRRELSAERWGTGPVR